MACLCAESAPKSEHSPTQRTVTPSNPAKFFRPSEWLTPRKKSVKHGNSGYGRPETVADDKPLWEPSLVFNQKLANGSCHQTEGPLSFRLVGVAAMLFAEHSWPLTQPCQAQKFFNFPSIDRLTKNTLSRILRDQPRVIRLPQIFESKAELSDLGVYRSLTIW